MFDYFKKKPGVFISDERHITNMQSQLEMTPQTMDQLYEHGVDESKKFKLEFFFYTNTEEKAKDLNGVLLEKGYQSKFDVSASDKKLYVVTGWTVPIQMNLDTVIEWTGEMCIAGHRADCEFDGWGTTLDQ